MLLGIVSDTHGYYDPELDEVLAPCDLILHAGDVGGDGSILDRLAALAPVHVVWGNVDGRYIRQRAAEHARFRAGGLRIWMTHIGGRPGRWARGIGTQLREERPDVFVCGHSHILAVKRVPELDGMLYINPGAAGRQGFHTQRTCLRLRVEEGKAREVEVVHLGEGVG